MSPVFDPDNPQGERVQFKPMTEKEIAEAACWGPGEYNFEVIEAEDTTSKSSGAEMIKLKIKVFNDEGAERTVFDYLLQSVAWKMRHFCYGTGLEQAYENGTLQAMQCVGKCGRVLLRIDQQEGYQAKNAVKDYVVGDGVKQNVKAANAAPAPSDSDEPPF